MLHHIVHMVKLWRTLGRDRTLQFLCTSSTNSAVNQEYVDFLPAASRIVSAIIAEQESDDEQSDMLPFKVDGCADSVLMNRYKIKFVCNWMIIWAYGVMVAFPAWSPIMVWGDPGSIPGAPFYIFIR